MKATPKTGVQMFRKRWDQGEAGDHIGVLWRGVKRDEIEPGQVLAKPGSITPHTVFFHEYRSQFDFRTTAVTGEVTLPEGTEMVMPGDNESIEVALITPIALEKALWFAIREGGRTVGAGGSVMSYHKAWAAGKRGDV